VQNFPNAINILNFLLFVFYINEKIEKLVGVFIVISDKFMYTVEDLQCLTCTFVNS